MSGEKEDEKGKATEPNRGWGVREVVTAALLSALTVVILFVGSMLCGRRGSARAPGGPPRHGPRSAACTCSPR